MLSFLTRLSPVPSVPPTEASEQLRLPSREVIDAVKSVAPSFFNSSSSRNIVQPVPNGEHWLKIINSREDTFSYFKEHLAGATLLDLGSSNRWQSMYEFAYRCGASRYVAVDLNLTSTKVSPDQIRPGCDVSLVKSDLLLYLASVEPGSCCVSMNGIDRCVVPSGAYHRLAAHYIGVAVPPGGIAFGILSESLTLLGAGGTAPLAGSDDNSVTVGMSRLFMNGEPMPGWIKGPVPYPDQLLKRTSTEREFDTTHTR